MSIARRLTIDDGEHDSSLASQSGLIASPSSRRASLCSPEKSRSVLLRRTSIDIAENELADLALAPEVEGRIFIVSDKVSFSYLQTNPIVIALDALYVLSNASHHH